MIKNLQDSRIKLLILITAVLTMVYQENILTCQEEVFTKT